MMPLTMTPVGANGDSAPDWAPLPTMIAIRNGGIDGALRRPPSPSAPASRPSRRCPARCSTSATASTKNITGISRRCRGRCGPRVRDPLERAVELRLREQQRHAGERQEQLHGKPADDVVERHAAEVHADDPRQRQRQATPTFSCVKQLRMMATASAASENQARFMRGRLLETSRIAAARPGARRARR